MSARSFGHGPMDFRMMSPAIKGLVAANVAIFVLSNLVGGQFHSIFGLVPAKVSGELWVWQLGTYLFIHASLMHLLFNLFALWMFGMAVEAQWGGAEFLRYYLICGVGAGVCSVLVNPGSPLPIIGASGAVYGLLTAFAMLYPEAVVYLYFFFPIKAKHMAILFGTIEFLAGTADRTPVVARFAHLGGMIIGYIYLRWGWALRSRLQKAVSGIAPAEPRARPRRARPARRLDPVPAADDSTEVDRILDKILAHGEGSLTEAERETLRRQAKDRPPEGRA